MVKITYQTKEEAINKKIEKVQRELRYRYKRQQQIEELLRKVRQFMRDLEM